MTTIKRIGLVSIALAFSSLPVWAQTGPDDNGGNPPPPPGMMDQGGQPPRMMDDLKQRLGMSDEDFNAVQPLLQKVMQLQRETEAHHGPPGGPRFGGPGGPGGGPPPGDFGGPGPGGPPPDDQGPNAQGQDQPPRPPQSDVQQKHHDLHEAIQNPDTSTADLKAKLDAFRAARDKAKDDLAKAQSQLIQLLTQRQEAVLVDAGFLD